MSSRRHHMQRRGNNASGPVLAYTLFAAGFVLAVLAIAPGLWDAPFRSFAFLRVITFLLSGGLLAYGLGAYNRWSEQRAIEERIREARRNQELIDEEIKRHDSRHGGDDGYRHAS